jgi:hypothetical protein
VLAASVTIALVVGNHRGIQFAYPGKRPTVPAVAETTPARPAAESPAAEPTIINTARAKDHESARLNDALRTLAAERDRLDERVQKLEQSLGDITASIRERAAAASTQQVQMAPRIPEAPDGGARHPESIKAVQRIAASSPPVPPEPARGAIPAAGVIGTPGGEAFLPYVNRPMVVPPSAAQEPMQIHAVPVVRETAAAAPSQESATTRTEFAIDLGTEPNMEALRARWASLRGIHAPLIGNLRPLVSVREGNRPGTVELRLIAGPLSNAGDAAKACASLQSKGVNCQTAVYDGQRLALR